MSPGRIRALVVVDASVDIEAIQLLIESQPGLALAGIIDNATDWAGRAGYQADVLLVATDGHAPEALNLIEEETRTRPQLPVVVVCSGSPNGFVRQVFAAGADDIVATHDMRLAGPDVLFAIQKAMSRKSAPHHDVGERGDLICVLGPKGGTGKTLTASNLAVALAEAGRRVALVDLDLQFGDLGLVLGLNPARSIYDLVTSGGTMDIEKAAAFMTPHVSGVHVLLAPTRPDHAAAVSPDFLKDLYSLLRTHYEYVVVDTPPGFTPEVIATIDSASAICLIATLDTPSLKNAKLGVETLDLMGYPSERVRVVLNRADTSVGVTHNDVVTVLGRAPDVLVPSNRDVVRSVNAGEPIVLASPRSEAAKAFRALAQIFLSSRVPASGGAAKHRARGLKALGRS